MNSTDKFLRAYDREKRLLDCLGTIRSISGQFVQELVDKALETNHYLLLQDLGRTEEINKQ